jgi:hypothetical protein
MVIVPIAEMKQTSEKSLHLRPPSQLTCRRWGGTALRRVPKAALARHLAKLIGTLPVLQRVVLDNIGIGRDYCRSPLPGVFCKTPCAPKPSPLLS